SLSDELRVASGGEPRDVQSPFRLLSVPVRVSAQVIPTVRGDESVLMRAAGPFAFGSGASRRFALVRAASNVFQPGSRPKLAATSNSRSGSPTDWSGTGSTNSSRDQTDRAYRRVRVTKS